MKLEKQLVIVNEFKQVTPRAMTRKILSEHLGTRRNAWNAPKSFGVDDLIALLRENERRYQEFLATLDPRERERLALAEGPE